MLQRKMLKPYKSAMTVYRHHAEKLFQLKPVQDTYEGLCKLLHDITRHSGGMKACGGNTFEQLIVALVEPLLPTLNARLWSDFTSETTSSPALVDLIKFFK